MIEREKLKKIVDLDESEGGLVDFKEILKEERKNVRVMNEQDYSLLLRWAVKAQKKYFRSYYDQLIKYVFCFRQFGCRCKLQQRNNKILHPNREKRLTSERKSKPVEKKLRKNDGYQPNFNFKKVEDNYKISVDETEAKKR